MVSPDVTQKGLQELSFRYCEADLGPFIVSFNPDYKGSVDKWPFLEETPVLSFSESCNLNSFVKSGRV